MWVYQKTEAHLWTVGFYDPQGKWHSESDHDSLEKAAMRVHFLNGQASDAINDLRETLKDSNEITFSVKIPEDASKLIELAHNVTEALKKFQEGHP